MTVPLVIRERLRVRAESGASSDPKWGLARSVASNQTRLTRPYEQVSWIFAAVKVVAQNIAGVPLAFYQNERTDDRKVELARFPPLAAWQRPNPWMGRRRFWEFVASIFWLDGEVAVVKESASDKRLSSIEPPAELWPISGKLFEPVYTDEAKNTVAWWKLSVGGKETLYAPHELIWLRDIDPSDPRRGFGRVQAALSAAVQDFSAAQWNATFFRQGAVPGGVIESEGRLNADQVNMVRSQFEDRHAGDGKAHRIAVLTQGMKWTQTQAAQRDMDFAALRNLSRDEILAVLGVPKIMVGIVEDYNRATASSAKAILFENTLLPVMAAWEDAVTEDVALWRGCANVLAGFDTSTVEALRENLATKVDTAGKLFELGYPTNEINKRLEMGLPDIEGVGDTSFLPASVMPAELAMEPPEPPPEAPAAPPDAEAEEEPEEDPDAEEAETAAPDAVERAAAAKFWRAHFQRTLLPVEKLARSKFSRYFRELRGEVLENLDRVLKAKGKAAGLELVREPSGLLVEEIETVLWATERWNKALREAAQKVWITAVQKATEGISAELGGLANWQGVSDPAVTEFIQQKLLKVTRINDTVRNRLRMQLLEGVGQGETIGELASRIRLEFNFANSRAVTIARTETAQAVGQTRLAAMKSEGFARHKWVTAHDHAVRDSHRKLDGLVVALGTPFPNGCTAPGDPTARPEEIINCRCVAVAQDS